MYPSQFPARYVTCYCPSCFKEILLGKCAILNSTNMAPIKHAPVKPEEIEAACTKVEPLTGAYYTSQQAQRQCYECDYLLPYNIESVASYTIAVVGDTFSGKTHYIAALLYQINEWINSLSNYGIEINCLTKTVEAQYKQHLKRLFKDQQALTGTHQSTSDVPPLIYELTIESNSFFRRGAKNYNIMIYDTAGEDFANNNKLVEYGKFALHADAIIFVIDPVPIPELFHDLDLNSLKNRQKLEINHSAGRRPVEIVKSVMHTFRRNHAQHIGRPLSDLPIAVMVSKADLFRYLNPAPSLQSFQRYPDYDIKVDFKDLDQVNQDVDSLLRGYGQGDLFSTLNLLRDRNRNNIRFFTSTATSVPPDANDEFRSTLPRPYRCLDPLMWIFYQLQILGRK